MTPPRPPSDSHNEADVETQVVIPFLVGVGIDPRELRTQKSFTLRLGRNVFRVVGEEAVDRVSGRSDYLVLNPQGRALFVVEAKAPGEPLTDDDRDQGISYARLLDDIAPFVLVTNGGESKLYDSITRREIGGCAESEYLRNGLRPSTDDVAFRAEALRHFLGLSEANVRSFSHQQVATHLGRLRGGDNDLTRKYIPRLYVRRPDVRAAIGAFLDSDAPVFVLAGRSGVGKTNEMCALAEELADRHLVCFFSGTEIRGSIEETLVQEFNWHFSQTVSAPKLCRRIHSLCGPSGGNRFICMIDAIDEADCHAIEQDLDALSSHLRGFENRLKLIVSLKSTEWPRFGHVRGVERGLIKNIWRSAAEAAGVEVNGPGEHEPSCVISPLDDSLRDVAIELYQHAFGIAGEWSPKIRAAAADPFLLRMVAEVAQASGVIPQAPDEFTLTRRYVDHKLRGMGATPIDQRDLKAVAEGLLRLSKVNDTDAVMVREDKLVEWGLVQVQGAINRELVSVGLLIETLNTVGQPELGFAYDRVRDYVVAAFVFSFPSQPDTQIDRTVRDAFGCAVGRSALYAYLPDAPEGQWVQLVRALGNRLTGLLDAYNAILGQLKGPVRQELGPTQQDQVGLAFDVTRDASVTFCIVGGEHGHSGVRNVPGLRFGFSRTPENVRLFLRDAARSSLYGRGRSVFDDPRAVGFELALGRVRQLLRDRHFPVPPNRTLLSERVLAICHARKRDLRLRQTVDSRSASAGLLHLDLLPLDLRSTRKLANIQLGFEDAVSHWARARAVPSASGAPGIRTMSHTSSDVEHLRVQAALAVENGAEYSGSRDSEMAILKETIDRLLAMGIQVINEPVLPPPDAQPSARTGFLEDDYTPEGFRSFVHQYLMGVVAGCHATAEEIFSGPLRDLALQYCPLPAVAIAYVDLRRVPNARGTEADITYTVTRATGAVPGNVAVEVHLAPEPTPFVRSRGPWVVRTSFGELPYRWEGGLYAMEMFQASNHGLSSLRMIVGGQRRWRDSDRFAPMLDKVCRLIEDGLGKAALAELEGREDPGHSSGG